MKKMIRAAYARLWGFRTRTRIALTRESDITGVAAVQNRSKPVIGDEPLLPSRTRHPGWHEGQAGSLRIRKTLRRSLVLMFSTNGRLLPVSHKSAAEPIKAYGYYKNNHNTNLNKNLLIALCGRSMYRLPLRWQLALSECLDVMVTQHLHGSGRLGGPAIQGWTLRRISSRSFEQVSMFRIPASPK
jgi:hypothetical protein